MENTYTIELDVYDVTDLAQDCRNYGISGKLVNPKGINGLPIWQYTGTFSKLSKFVEEVYLDDLSDYFEKVS